MFLSFFLITILLIASLAQIYFLGNYFSITQEAFINKRSAIIATGFMFYIFITFIFIIPFFFFRVSSNYINITLAIKDISIGLFLISRRDIFKKNKINIFANLWIILIVVLIIVFYYYVGPIIDKQAISITNSKDYFLLSKINNYLNVLTFSNNKRILYFYIWPLLSIGIISIIIAFYSMFIKRNNFLIYFITIITILLLLLLFNSNLSLEIVFSLVILIFLFQIGINVITFSRRRYAILFGVGVLASWSLNNYLFLALVTLALCLILAYGILKRPHPSLFAIQLIAPIILISIFWIIKYYKVIAIILFAIVIIVYFLLFFIIRIQVIKNNLLANKLSFLIPIFIFLGLFTYSLIKIFSKSDLNADFLWKGRSFINDFNNKDLAITINIIYYVIFGGTIGYSIYLMVARKRIIGIKLVFLIASIGFILIYNPFIQETLISLGISEKYINKLLMITIVPVLMVLAICIIKKSIKFIEINLDSKTKVINAIKKIKTKGK